MNARFTLKVIDPAHAQFTELILSQVRRRSPNAANAVDDTGEPLGRWNWTTHEDELKALSLFDTGLTFELTGREEDGSAWRKWFTNGRMARVDATVTFPAYDPATLDGHPNPEIALPVFVPVLKFDAAHDPFWELAVVSHHIAALVGQTLVVKDADLRAWHQQHGTPIASGVTVVDLSIWLRYYEG